MFQAIIENILNLTEQKDVPTLDLIFLETISSLFAPASVSLYELLDEKGTEEFNDNNMESVLYRNAVDENNHKEYPLSERGDFCECIIRKKPVIRIDHSRNIDITIYPIIGEQGASSLFVLEMKESQNLDLETLQYLFRAYASHRKFLKSFDCDPLTGLLNRRAFERHSYELAKNGKKKRRRFYPEKKGTCFAIIDIDHFKSVNDTYGHLFGDYILILIARIIVESFRHYDLSFRYGGEEFCIILDHVDEGSAIQLMERFRKNVENYNFPHVETITVTIGLTKTLKDDQPADIIGRADKALYFGKAHGRNRVISFDKLFRAGLISNKQGTDEWHVF